MSLEPILAPYLVGTAVNLVLLGISMAQAFSFFIVFGRSSMVLFYLVLFLSVVNAIHTALCFSTTYFLFVSNFGNLPILSLAPITYALEPCFSGVTASATQIFFAIRVNRLSKGGKVIPAIILALSFLQLAFAFASSIEIFILDRQFLRFHEFNYGVETWLVSAMLCDVIITGALSYYLKRFKSEFHQTNSIVDSILKVTIETNGVTCAVAIIQLVFFLKQPIFGLGFIAPELCLSKFYFISLLRALNGRAALADKMKGLNGAAQSPSQIQKKSSNKLVIDTNTGYKGVMPSHELVKVTIAEQIDVDMDSDFDQMEKKAVRFSPIDPTRRLHATVDVIRLNEMSSPESRHPNW